MGLGHITQKFKFAIEYYADKLSLKQREYMLLCYHMIILRLSPWPLRPPV